MYLGMYISSKMCHITVEFVILRKGREQEVNYNETILNYFDNYIRSTSKHAMLSKTTIEKHAKPFRIAFDAKIAKLSTNRSA